MENKIQHLNNEIKNALSLDQSQKQFLQTADNNSLVSVVANPGKPLSLIKKEEGEIVSLAIVAKAVESVANALNRGKNLSGPQIIEIATLTCKEFFYLTESQLNLLAERIKLNKYPEIKILDSFDCILWFQFVEAFVAELKIEKKRQKLESEQQQRVQWEQEKAPPEVAKKYIEELNKLFPKGKVKGLPAFPEKSEEQRQLERVQYMEFKNRRAEFLRIYAEQNPNQMESNAVLGKRIKINNDLLTFDDFIKTT